MEPMGESEASIFGFHVGFWDGSVGETKSASKRFLLLPGVSFIPANMAKHRHFGSDEPHPKNYLFFIIMNFEIATFFSKLQVPAIRLLCSV